MLGVLKQRTSSDDDETVKTITKRCNVFRAFTILTSFTFKSDKYLLKIIVYDSLSRTSIRFRDCYRFDIVFLLRSLRVKSELHLTVNLDIYLNKKKKRKILAG